MSNLGLPVERRQDHGVSGEVPRGREKVWKKVWTGTLSNSSKFTTPVDSFSKACACYSAEVIFRISPLIYGHTIVARPTDTIRAGTCNSLFFPVALFGEPRFM